MCGRYVSPDVAEAERYFLVNRVHWRTQAPRYNVAPTQSVPVVRREGGEREGLLMRWGLVPAFCRGVVPKYSTINATIEKLESGPCWRGPWQRAQRCIVPAVGFYEWHLLADGSKRPYFIQCTDQPMFGFAGLWDRSIAPDGAPTLSCTIITLPPNELLARIHNARQRMPAILCASDLDTWLSGSTEEAARTLRPYPAQAMTAWAVSARVNSPRNDSCELIQPVAT